MNKARLRKTFMELVQIDSVSGHEGQIQRYLKQAFAELDFEVQEDDAMNDTGFGANNLICTLEANAPYQHAMLFTSHMDTVQPGQNVKPIIQDGYIYSEGETILGADDKAGIAVLLETFKTIQEDALPHGKIQILLTIGEESGLLGIKALDPDMIKSDMGFTLDATKPVGETVIGGPARTHFKVAIIAPPGKAQLSATQIASRVIQQLELGTIDEQTKVTLMKMGGEPFAKSDAVRLEFELKSFSNETIRQVARTMKQTIEETTSMLNAKALMEIIELYPAFKVQEDTNVVTIAEESAKRIGLEPETSTVLSGSDGTILNQYGLETVILGVGFEDIHTTSERIAIQSLEDLTRQTLEIIALGLFKESELI